MLAETALFVLVQIPFWVDVDTVDNDADMQMISGYIAGSTNLGNGVVLVHRIANLRQKLAAMGIERTIPTAMIDDQIISVADMIPRFDDGEISSTFETHHAVGMTTADGAELLMHIGIDTVKLLHHFQIFIFIKLTVPVTQIAEILF